MGMFDSVYLKCPKCDEEQEIQSKAGDCILRGYHDDVPKDIGEDIDGKSVYCEGCEAYLRVAIRQNTVYRALLVKSEDY